MTTNQKKSHRTYRLEEYDPLWTKQFEDIALRVKNILGNELADIFHIGSTSIPGMIAKPQIDILGVVRDLSKVKNFYSEIEKAGFKPRGNYTGINEEYFTEDTESGERLSSIHIVELGHPEIEILLNFRDYLRIHQEDRELYAKTKRALYKDHKDDYSFYDTGKKDIILLIRDRAKNWAAEIKK